MDRYCGMEGSESPRKLGLLAERTTLILPARSKHILNDEMDGFGILSSVAL